MSLESLGANSDRPRDVTKASVALIVLWTVWVVFMSVLKLPASATATCTVLVLLFGGYCWQLLEGFAYLVLMSLIYSGVSLTPSGFYWIAMAVVLIAIKILSYRVSLQTSIEFAVAAMISALVFESIQIAMLAQLNDRSVLSWVLVGRLLLLSAAHGAIGLVVARPFLQMMGARA